MEEYFDFCGLTLVVRSDSAAIVEEVRRDFAYFRVPRREAQAKEGFKDSRIRGSAELELHMVRPPYAELPAIPASFLTPRNVCFKDGRLSYIDYFGRGLAVWNRQARQCVVYGMDGDLVHEIAYLFILSLVGQYLDSRGIHRLHALGVGYGGRALLLLLPSGGGKSTMALELLRHPGFSLLSEDTPLIDRRGWVLPFPLRPGVRPGQATGIPQKYLRTMRRMEFDPKTLIDIEYFQGRLGEPVPAGFLLVGQRNLGEVSEIVPLARHRAAKALVNCMVVGLGVYQGLEFLLERGAWELLKKTPVVGSRLRNSLRLLARVRAYRFVLGRDRERNNRTLLDFVRRTCE